MGATTNKGQNKMKTATVIKDVSENFRGTATLYKVSHPIEDGWVDEDEEPVFYEYVISSNVNCEFAHESMLFPAREDGTKISSADLYCVRGSNDPDDCLTEMGYEIVL